MKPTLDVVRHRAQELNVSAQSYKTKHVLWPTHSSDRWLVPAAPILTLFVPALVMLAFFLSWHDRLPTTVAILAIFAAVSVPFLVLAISASERYAKGNSILEPKLNKRGYLSGWRYLLIVGMPVLVASDLLLIPDWLYNTIYYIFSVAFAACYIWLIIRQIDHSKHARVIWKSD